MNYNQAIFKKFANLFYDRLGITIKDNKITSLRFKLEKVMRICEINSFEILYDELTKKSNKIAWKAVEDYVTTHKTDFFREIKHFNFITENIQNIISKQLPRIIAKKEIRVWSSASSTGEEPYTIAMVLKEILPHDINIKILATDISSDVIVKGQAGLYNNDIDTAVPNSYLKKYFTKVDDKYQVCDELKKCITFRQFNLMGTFPFKNSFDIIFCRNVMIYFDTKTQNRLIHKFYDFIMPGGYLIIGLSETLINMKHPYKNLGTSIYQKLNTSNKSKL